MLKDGSGDFLTLLLAVLLGTALCLIYDILRALRENKRHTTAAMFIEDIIFCVVAAFCVFILQLVRSFGEMRWFIFFGLAVGFIVCRMTASRIFVKLFGFIIVFVTAAIRFISDKIITPLQSACKKLCTFLRKIFKKLLQSLYSLRYNVIYDKMKRNRKRAKKKCRKESRKKTREKS